MILGVSWTGQFIFALASFGFGLGGGIVSRLYFIKDKINKIEQGIVDFFVTITLALVYLVCVELVGKGQLTIYSLFAFILGIWIFNLLWRKIAHSLGASRRGGKLFKK